VQTRTAP